MRYEYARDEKLKEWRWVLKSDNRAIIAISPGGYRDRRDCVAAIERVKSSADAPVVEVKMF